MSTHTKPSERVRPRLETLRNTLRHWQICSNEYKILRMELSTLSPKSSREQMLAVGAKLSGKLVDLKEVENLLGDEFAIKRTVVQVIAEVIHRIDYAQENVIKLEQQIEQGEGEIDENEEEEEDAYEVDTKYKPTAEGLISHELQIELEEFRKRIKERGELARAEEAKWVAEEKKKPKKGRQGGVRFAEEPEEVPTIVPKPLPLPALAQATKYTIPIAEDQLAMGSNKLGEVLKSETTGISSLTADGADFGSQFSIAKELQQTSRKGFSTTEIDLMVCEDSSPQAAREVLPNPPCPAHTSPPLG